MRIDSHQHFWSYNPEQYAWIRPEWPICRSYLPEALAGELVSSQFDGCVAVQARQTVGESRWLLGLADRFPFIKGVVGWVDLRAPEVAAVLEELTADPKFVGVRHVVQDEPDDEFLCDEGFQRGIAQLHEFGLTYDLLIYARQIPAAIKLVRAFPAQPFVLDHIAKPPVKAGLMEPWRGQIRELARHSNVFCKISGLITEGDWTRWQPAHFRPYLEVVSEAFGPDRLVFGSDWPVALLAGTYRQVFDLVRDFAGTLGAEAEARLFGGNAVKFYGLK